ncbi:MAG: SDR family oxidoreductase [Acidimicrobiales bacterium]
MPGADRPTLLVTGATGYLGRALVPLAARRAEVIGASQAGGGGRVALDVADRRQVFELLEGLRPAAVIHAAAVNPPEGPERRMEAVNVAGSAHVAEAAAAVGARLVHVSTDVIFDGRAAPYADDASPTPLGEYGRTKAAGEAEVLARCPGAVSVRTSLIYGLRRIDRGTQGFVKTLASMGELVLYRDVLRQPVSVEALSAALLALALDHRQERGTLNVAGRQAISRAAFGRRLLDWWGVDTEDRIVEVDAALAAPDVPLDLRLRLDRAERLGFDLPGVDEVLERSGAARRGD